MKKKKKGAFSTILLILILIVGLSLLLYPTVSNYWNSLVQSKAVAQYADAVANLNEEEYQAILDSAIDYNRELQKYPSGYAIPKELSNRYPKELAVDDSGIMGIIEIPTIGVNLPVYHGTGEEVLQVAIGHLNWSSLPVGGRGTHCVVSGHRGLPSAKLFTNLDQLREGDAFMLRVLNEILTYEIDTIVTVEPSEVSSLKIDNEKDLCTLVTCTPYGVNSHRLLITGHRVGTLEEEKSVRVVADGMQIEPLLVAPVIAISVLLIIVIILLLPRKRKGGKTVKIAVENTDENNQDAKESEGSQEIETVQESEENHDQSERKEEGEQQDET